MIEKILKALDDIKKCGVVIESKPTKRGEVYRFGNSRYDVEVTLEYPQWVGLEFRLHKSKIEYSIDTDLYKLDDPSNQQFVFTIESGIVAFLNNLKDGLIKAAYKKKHVILLIPQSDDYILIKEGMITTTQTSLKTPDKALAKYDFVTFPLRSVED